MKTIFLSVLGLIFAAILCGCTERRRADAPQPDGDTVEVVIPDSND